MPWRSPRLKKLLPTKSRELFEIPHKDMILKKILLFSFSWFHHRTGLKYFLDSLKSNMNRCTIKCTSVVWPKNQNNITKKDV